jgi:hypothetical protein
MGGMKRFAAVAIGRLRFTQNKAQLRALFYDLLSNRG